MSEIFCGFDASLVATGLCKIIDGKVEIATVKTKPKDFPNDIERLKHIIKETMSYIPNDVKLLCLEDVYISPFQTGSSMKLMGLAYLIRMALYDRKIPFMLISPNQLKKFLTGKGNADKNIILREVFKRYGVNCEDDNQSDSCVMAYLAKALYAYIHEPEKLEVTVPQKEVIKAIIKDRPRYWVEGIQTPVVEEE